jgi:hypothetical protein
MSEVHCWESEREWIETMYGDDSEEYYEYMASVAPSRACLLPSGRDGPHVWTDNEDIVLKFNDPPNAGNGETKGLR